MIFNLRLKKGQSLIEAMVALGVLTIGFLGILSLLSKSLFYGRDVSDTMKATYLASEGIEITKNLIDYDVMRAIEGIPGGGWGSCFNLSPGGQNDFEFDHGTTACGNLPSYSGKLLLFDSSSNLYDYTVSPYTTQTNFVRRIRVAESGDGTEITVKSIVTWSTGPITTQSVNMEDHFYNWRPQG